MKWITRITIASCIAAWAAFLSGGCVDVPVPIDGQVYLCTVSDAGDATPLFQVERCGPWDDWTVPAEELAAELSESPRKMHVDCRGTRRACAWKP